MKNPHICFVAPYLDNYFDSQARDSAGGAERQQYLLAKNLAEDGYEVSAITYKHENSKIDIKEDVKLYKILPEYSSKLDIPFLISNLAFYMWKIDADLFYTRGNTDLCIATSYCCDFLNKKFIYSLADDTNASKSTDKFINKIYENIYSNSLNISNNIISQTNNQKELLKINYNIESTTIPNMYPIPNRKRIRSHEERDYFLWVGDISREQKQPWYFLDLAEKLPKVEFIMVGPGNGDPLYTKTKQRAQEIPNLEFEGFVEPDEIGRYYNKAIGLVNTSKYEGFPNTFLESWSYATPVISLTFDIDEILSTENIGYKAGDLQNLKEIAEDLYINPDKRKRIGWNGRKFLKENYSFEKIYPKYKSILTP
ncbi:glycosyltransferase family 4 protein [Natronorubrum sp. A-ect3]|uniref:glycosyltransferase family 4 protein n=1 Tax=Natronorubrum sp. A-ect3 TaxID=3242698 RepID=UPI00359EE558